MVNTFGEEESETTRKRQVVLSRVRASGAIYSHHPHVYIRVRKVRLKFSKLFHAEVVVCCKALNKDGGRCCFIIWSGYFQIKGKF
jgi:hypothetical protein